MLRGQKNPTWNRSKYCSKFNKDFKNGPHKKKKKPPWKKLENSESKWYNKRKIWEGTKHRYLQFRYLKNYFISFHQKSKRVPEKHLLLLYWLCQSLWLCGSQQLWTILKEMGIPRAVLRWQRNRMGRPRSPLQINQKIIWMLNHFHKTTSERWRRTPGTQKGNPFSSKGGRKNI